MKFLSLNDIVGGGKKAVRDFENDRKTKSQQRADKVAKALLGKK